MDGHYFHAWCPSYRVFLFAVEDRFCFCDGRTDTLCENNDHLFGRGLVDQKVSEKRTRLTLSAS